MPSARIAAAHDVVVLDDLVLGHLEHEGPLGRPEDRPQALGIGEQARRDVEIEPDARGQAFRAATAAASVASSSSGPRPTDQASAKHRSGRWPESKRVSAS